VPRAPCPVVQCNAVVQDALETLHDSPPVLTLSLSVLFPRPLVPLLTALPSHKDHPVCQESPLAPLAPWRHGAHGRAPGGLLCDAFVLPSYTQQAKLLVVAVAFVFAFQIVVLFLRDLFGDLATGRWLKVKAE
jgi:hypothetical protein